MAKRITTVERVEAGGGDVLAGLRLSALQNHKLNGFSVERSMKFLTDPGSDLEIRIRKPKCALDRIRRIFVEAA
jgi:hypothetical protein